MVNTIGRVLRLSALLPLLLPVLFVANAFAADANEEIEEIVVTGSYLKRNAADSPSPLSIIDRAAMEEIGPTDLKDIIQSMTYNSGSLGAGSNVYDGGDSSTGTASINLRNLGNGSTLVLINGKRNVLGNYDLANNGYTDIAGMMPNIAIERVEVVKDGSSALYGSDAIAGVVNFITRDDYEGFELNITYQTDDETHIQDDLLIEGILGVQNDRGGIVVAMSHLSRDGIQAGDRFEDYGRSGLSGNGQPGRFVPIGPTFAPDGVTPAAYGRFADLDCEQLVQPDFKGTQGVFGGFPPAPDPLGTQCIYDFSSFFNFVEEGEVNKVSVTGHYMLDDNIEVYGDAMFSDNRYNRGNSLFPATIPPTIPADNLGVINDAARRGVAPQALTASWRLLGGSTDTPFDQRPASTDTDSDVLVLRMTGGLNVDFTIGDRDWSADVSITRSQRKFSGNTRSDAMTGQTNLAFAGLGGTTCDVVNGTPGSGNINASMGIQGAADCFYLNPFASAYIKPDGTPQDDPLLMNPPELLESLVGDLTQLRDQKMVAVDFVFAGDLFDVPAGTVGLAVGGQWRREDIDVDNDRIRNNNQVLFAFGERDWDGQLTTTGIFAEVNIPITEDLEINVAGRFEDFDEIDADTFDPKLTALWRVLDSLTLRASIGTSFRAPSLLQAFGFNTTLLNTSDPLDPGGPSLFIPAITTGNAALEPEEATTFGIGLSWAPVDGPLEGLAIDLDYYDYEYEDIMSRQSSSLLVASDLSFRCPNGLSTTPGLECGFQPDGSFATINPGNPQVVRDPGSGTLLRTNVLLENSQSLDTSGLDLDVRYSWEWGNAGLFRAQLIASYTLDYDLVTASGGKVDGVGSRNLNNSVGHPLPEYRFRTTLGWTRDRHAASIAVTYIDGYKDDSAGSGLFLFLTPFIGGHAEVDSMTTVDLQYNLQLPAIGFQSEGSTITLGAKNVFNEDAPKTTKNGLYDPFTHDPRGRMYYATYKLAI